MKFIPSTHPDTGKPPVGMVEVVLGLALLMPGDEDETYDYADETKVAWNTQRPLNYDGDQGPIVELYDEDFNSWFAHLVDPNIDELYPGDKIHAKCSEGGTPQPGYRRTGG